MFGVQAGTVHQLFEENNPTTTTAHCAPKKRRRILMKQLSTFLAIIFTLILALSGCNDHKTTDNNNTDNGIVVEVLSPVKTALWVELSDGDYDFALARDRVASDLDLIGNSVPLPSGLAAMVTTGQDKLVIKADETLEVWEVPTDQIGTFEMLVRNVWSLPAGWQPNLFPKTEGEAYDLEILLSAFICGQNLDLYTRGCQSQIPSSLFRKIDETAYYEWSNPGHAKYVFVIRR
ncbi:hypothetical protein C0416_05590 [bacterium]|nr:hypothetical protein [bacterium]